MNQLLNILPAALFSVWAIIFAFEYTERPALKRVVKTGHQAGTMTWHPHTDLRASEVGNRDGYVHPYINTAERKTKQSWKIVTMADDEKLFLCLFLKMYGNRSAGVP